MQGYFGSALEQQLHADQSNSRPPRLHVYIDRKTGIIIFGEEKTGLVQRYAKSLEDNSVPHQVMPAREANKKYSDQLQLPEDYLCLTEEDGGILRASKAVATLQVS